ncbi:MAG: thioredoxin family protein [Candidatus Omnitrophota bacterium]|jgi:DNA replication protein DnaC
MKIKVFGKKNCAKCETTKNKINHYLKKSNNPLSASLEFHDLDTVEGMTEGAYNDILKVPTTLIENGDDVLVRWDGEVPKTEDFAHYLQ